LTVGGIGSLVAVITLRRSQLKDRRERDQAEADKRNDRLVIQALEDRAQWTGPRPMTTNGDLCVRADELADALSIDVEAIFDSLKRLEARGRVMDVGGHLADSTSRWSTTRLV
jgi:predicted Rossmann fold nucleotide-binding protein DprA/Smf involved in DNA uptake